MVEGIALTDLEPQWLVWEGDKIFRRVSTKSEAGGLMFACPLCYVAKGNRLAGVHSIICWSRSAGTPDDADPKPGRWRMDGLGFGDLTLNADPPGTARSVLLLGGCEAHFFITDGRVTL